MFTLPVSEEGVSKVGNSVLTVVCVAWMAVAAWSQFTDLPEGTVENHSSETTKERMRDCSGTFKQRYECKNAIVIETDRNSFFNVLSRILVIVVPPVLLVGGLHLWRKRSEDDRPDDDLLHQDRGRRRHRRTSHHR